MKSMKSWVLMLIRKLYSNLYIIYYSLDQASQHSIESIELLRSEKKPAKKMSDHVFNYSPDVTENEETKKLEEDDEGDDDSPTFGTKTRK